MRERDRRADTRGTGSRSRPRRENAWPSFVPARISVASYKCNTASNAKVSHDRVVVQQYSAPTAPKAKRDKSCEMPDRQVVFGQRRSVRDSISGLPLRSSFLLYSLSFHHVRCAACTKHCLLSPVGAMHIGSQLQRRLNSLAALIVLICQTRFATRRRRCC